MVRGVLVSDCWCLGSPGHVIPTPPLPSIQRKCLKCIWSGTVFLSLSQHRSPLRLLFTLKVVLRASVVPRRRLLLPLDHSCHMGAFLLLRQACDPHVSGWTAAPMLLEGHTSNLTAACLISSRDNMIMKTDQSAVLLLWNSG